MLWQFSISYDCRRYTNEPYINKWLSHIPHHHQLLSLQPLGGQGGKGMFKRRRGVNAQILLLSLMEASQRARQCFQLLLLEVELVEA